MKLSSYPHLVKEWHPSKNGESTIIDRVRTMVKCPYCAGKKTLNFDLFK